MENEKQKNIMNKLLSFDKFKNYNPEYLNSLVNQFIDIIDETKTKTYTYKVCVENFPKLSKDVSKNALKFWTSRGWNDFDSHKKQKEAIDYMVSKKTSKFSPFNFKFYLDKGFSLDEAKYSANKIRPIKHEYWLERGYNLDDAIAKSKEIKNKNNKIGLTKIQTKDDYKNPKRVEYWMIRGYSTLESKDIISKSQSTFSLEKCIQKHGLEIGTKIWQDRQDLWQQKLNSKTNEEKLEINLSKSQNLYKFVNDSGGDINNGINLLKTYCAKKKYKLYKTLDELNSALYDKMYVFGFTEKTLLSNFAQYQFGVFGIYNHVKYCEGLFGDKWNTFENRDGGYQTVFGTQYCGEDSQGNQIRLMSILENTFYKILNENNIKFVFNKKYENSRMRYDFYLYEKNIYIEICGMMHIRSYKMKMEYKRDVFGAVLLETYDDMIKFIKDYNNES